jgi:hypothetical protein
MNHVAHARAVLALVLGLPLQGGCAANETRCAEPVADDAASDDVTREPAKSVKPADKQAMITALVAALGRVGLECDASHELVVCDKKKEDRLALIPSAVREGDVAWIALATSFRLKPDKTCAQADEAFAKAASDLHMICNQENRIASFIAQTMVPEAGLSDRDVRLFASWFRLAMMPALGPLIDGGILE